MAERGTTSTGSAAPPPLATTTSPQLATRWAPAPSDFVEVRGQVVHLRDEGPRDDPVPLLLLHGTGDSLHAWEGWAAGLKDRRRVIRIDLPGAGLTGPFGGDYAPDDYRGDTLARFTLDLLDRLHLQRVVLGGHALGGEVAWRVASLAPQRVDRLILVDASGLDVPPQELPLPAVQPGSDGSMCRLSRPEWAGARYGKPARYGLSLTLTPSPIG